MSDLQALSDIELHTKCLEYGMPNIPITDYTRKIIKRRLEVAMSGKSVTSAKKNRRQSTIHVSRPSEISSSIEMTGRNDIGIGNTAPSKKCTIPIQNRHDAMSTTVSEPKYCDVLPNSGKEPYVISADTQLELPTTDAKLQTKEPLLQQQKLSRTGVLATSFMQEHRSQCLDNTFSVSDDLDSVGKYFRQENFERPIIAVSPLKICESRSSYYNNAPSSSTSTTAGTSQNINVYAKTYVEYEDLRVQTQFLSQYARRLETRKTSPFRYSVRPTKMTPPKSAALRQRVQTPRGDNIASRLSLTYTPPPFREKYHLKLAFAIISTFIIAVYICVFFI